ncbi:MAG: lysine--tRNA ligase [Candidatus Nanohaloarchaea archaeon]|nr:lysine--tRNA ligase [Candidatus Nanohaloarchaea archaeon]
MEQPLFWSDQLAFGITRKFEDRDVYVCASGITPSGRVHAGNFREIITTDFVVKSLQNMGERTRFIYSWDDYDRFRKVPKQVPDKWKQYIGLPVSEVPDPWNCQCGSYARHFEKKLEEELEDLHMEVEFIRQSEMFQKSKYAELIKKAMNRRDEIKEILDQYRKEPLGEDWYPLRVYCKECGKDFTDIKSYDGDYTVEYHCKECEEDFGVNFKENDSVKPSWRVDWPMRWAYENVAFEPGGKDHSAAGSSRDTGKEIVKEVFNSEPPVYQMYDFVSLKGLKGKMSSSSGDNVTLTDLKEVYTPEIIRFLFSETKPNKEFDISFDEDIISIYSKFDHVEDVYFNPEQIDNERKRKHLKRVYELAVVEIPEKQPLRAPFDHLAFLAQTRPREEWGEEVMESLKRTGHIRGDISEDQKDHIVERMEKALNWAETYAPDKYRYKISSEVSSTTLEELSTGQIEAMKDLAEILEGEEFEDKDELEDVLFDLPDKHGIETGEFFKAAYQCLLGRDQGPRLSNFILALGQDKARDILSTI